MITTGVQSYLKLFWRLLKKLEQGNKMFQKFVETRFLKKPEKIYSPITRQNIDKATI